MPTWDLLVIGASAGGVEALSALITEFPRDLPAAVCIVWRLGARSRNLLPQILTRVGRFRCHTGHAYTLASVVSEVEESVEAALWNGIRILEEQQLVLLHLAEQVAARDDSLAAQLRQEAQAVAQREQLVRQAIVPTAEGNGSG